MADNNVSQVNIKALEITGLRGFAQLGRLEPGIPNGKPGSGLTMLIGPNNGGKSTIIEALAVMSRNEAASFAEGKRNQRTDSRVSIRIVNSLGQTRELRTVDGEGSETVWIERDLEPRSTDFFVLPSRRTFNPFFGRGGGGVRSNYMNASGLPNIRSSPLDQFHTRLFQIQQNRTAFDDVLGRVLDPLPIWNIELSDQGGYYLRFRYGDAYHNSDGLGEGLVSLLFIIDALYDSQPGHVIAIDEPELSLHPSLQRKLYSLFAQYASDRQIICATHSPYFIDWEAISNGASIARVHKPRDTNSTTISPLSNETTEQIMRLTNDKNNPHTLGLDAREAFFLEDNLILVEGQEDVVFYKEIARQLGCELRGSFFGWGVGGAEKMRLIAKMLFELGFKKILGILDNNQQGLKGPLETEFPQLKVLVIPADDVRTKPERREREAVKGLLDETGHIRSEYQEEVRNLFESVNQYFQPASS